MFHIQEHVKKITLRRVEGRTERSVLRILAADTSAVTGGKQKITIIDELHELAQNAKAPAILTEVFGALNARPDGFVLVITTQSKEPPRGVFKQMVERARDVRDGKIDLPILPIIYELPSDLGPLAWREEKNWPLVNPNLGRSVDPIFLRTALAKADGAGTAAKEELALLASQHFNVEIGAAQRADRWVGAEFWENAADPGLTLDTLIERCEVVCIGLDGGGADDLFGVCVRGRDRNTREWLAWGRAFAHRIVLERRKSEATLLLDFERDGDLVFDGGAESFEPRRRGQPGEAPATPFDIAGILQIVEKVDAAGVLHKVGLDPAGVGGVVDALSEIGVGSPDDEAARGYCRVVGVPQGFALMRGIKTVERKLRDRTLWHAPQPLMDWCASNARTEYRANYVMVTKAVSGVGKIDPVMALFDAAFLMADNPEAPDAPSIYNNEAARPQGFLVI
jgi:phage terminase large subunit-like protein